VALPIRLPVEAEGLLAVGPVRDDGPCALAFQPIPEFGAVIGLVSEQLAGRFGATDEARGGWAIMPLAAAQQDGNQAAPGIGDGMDLGIAPAA
jgi:hypothetical protein